MSGRTEGARGTEQIPATMKAMVLMRHGGLDALEYHTDWPVPVPHGREVLIRVAACGLNNTDVNTRTGWYSSRVTEGTRGAGHDSIDDADPTWGGAPISLPRIQGADVAGRVVACGPQADPDLIGRRVITDNWLRDWDDPLRLDGVGYLGSEADGGFAEFVCLDERNVAAVDCALTDAELATFSCSGSTAEGMLARAAVGPGDTVLVTGASGGVGSALIQLAKRRGTRVVAMASEAKHDGLRELGADALLPRAPEDLAGALHEAIGQATVDVVADVVGGPGWAALIDCLARGGRYVASGAIAGPMVTLDLRKLYLRDLSLLGSTVIPPHVFRDLVGYIERGEIRPLLAATYPLAALREAQEAFIAKCHVGNIVVLP